MVKLRRWLLLIGSCMEVDSWEKLAGPLCRSRSDNAAAVRVPVGVTGVLTISDSSGLYRYTSVKLARSV